MTADFKDHFSDRAAGYATYRPHYPPALADYLAGIATNRGTAWDVGCGSGQLSTLLGDRFEHVIATDASHAQIARADAHPHVEYTVASAEKAPIDDSSIDLITVAQAAHWFDLPRFYDEVQRVARPAAGIALVTYGITRTDESIRAVVDHFYYDTLKSWWAPERLHPESEYRDLAFPFKELEHPAMEMTVDWSVEQLIGYVRTWSAVRAMEKSEGVAQTEEFAAAVRAAWGPTAKRRVWWRLGIRAGRVS